VTPTPSSTISQLLLTPVGTISVFGFKTPIPYPFGLERIGYLVTDMDKAVRAAQAAGADVIVSPFNDPIGRDAVIQFPGGVNTQLYFHTTAPSYAPLVTIPENRVYVPADKAEAFLRSFLAFSFGRVVSDDKQASGVEIGRPGDTYRRIQIESKFGRMTVLVTDGHLPYPYGWDLTGYAVTDLSDTLAKAKSAGVTVLVAPYEADQRQAAIVQFPGRYIAEIHSAGKKGESSGKGTVSERNSKPEEDACCEILRNSVSRFRCHRTGRTDAVGWSADPGSQLQTAEGRRGLEISE
jgi:hypothetical protein